MIKAIVKKYTLGPTFLPLLGLVAGAAALAYGGVFVRESEIPPTASAVYRVLLASPVFFILSWLFSRSGELKPKSPKHGITKLVLVGFIFSGNLALYHWSIYYTTLANSNLLANMAPIFVVLFSYLLFKVRFKKGFLLGVAITIFGAILLLNARLHLAFDYTLGNIFGILSGAFYGIYILAVNRVRADFDTLSVMGWSSLGTFLVLFPVTLATGEQLFPNTLDGVITLIELALIAHVVGQGLIAYALAHLPVALSSVTLVIQVVFSAAFGWMLLSETPLAFEFVGGVVIIIGILIARRNS